MNRVCNLSCIPNHEILARLQRTLSQERSHVAEFLCVLAEIEERKLHVELGFSSLFAYCVEALQLSEDQAYRRVAVARAARRFSTILPMIAAGEIHMTGVAKLAKHLTPGNHAALLEQAKYKTKAQIEHLIATAFPANDVTPSIRRVPALRAVRSKLPAARNSAGRTEGVPSTGVASKATLMSPSTSSGGDPSADPFELAAPPSQKRSVVVPTSAEAYSVRFTASARAKALLDQAKDLLAHQIPNADVGKIFELGLEALVGQLEKKKWKTTNRPKTAPTPPAEPQGRAVPHATVRAVHRRDGGRCTYIGPGRRRCSATSRLELDHILPFALGGRSVLQNLRLRCRAHNLYTAEQIFGRETMRRHTGRRNAPAPRESLGPGQGTPSISSHEGVVTENTQTARGALRSAVSRADGGGHRSGAWIPNAGRNDPSV